MVETDIQELRNKMFRYARSIVSSDAVAEDVVQDVFLKLLPHGGILNLEAFAMRSVRNRSLDLMRRYRFSSDAPLPDIPTENSAGEAKDLILKAMKALPAKQREAIHLRDIEGYEMEQAAAIMGVRESNYRVILSRSRKALKEIVLKLL